MTMSVAVTQRTGQQDYSRYHKITYTFVSAADGTATGATTGRFTGKIEAAQFIPDGGPTQPTNLFDVAVTDGDGHDVLAGAGADRPNTGVSILASASLGVVVNDVLTLNVSNAGDTKGGSVVLYLKV